MHNNVVKLKRHLYLAAACVAVFSVAMVATSYLARTFREVDSSSVARFDFSFASDEALDWVGPKVGQRIHLGRLKTQEGKTLASLAGNNLVMVVLVDEKCGACTASSDQMRYVQSRIGRAGVDYYAASVTTLESPSQLYEYTQSLGIRSPPLLWQSQEEKPPTSLFAMVLPSHLLLDNSGVIVRKWPGTDKSKAVRRRMANQIVTDTLEEAKFRARP